jgi:hypothetical protein
MSQRGDSLWPLFLAWVLIAIMIIIAVLESGKGL